PTTGASTSRLPLESPVCDSIMDHVTSPGVSTDEKVLTAGGGRIARGLTCQSHPCFAEGENARPTGQRGDSMRTMRFVSALLLATLVHDARAQINPPPANATVINFDDMPGASSVADVPGPLTTEYVDRGIIFAGFGQNGGGLT